ncbi:MAG: patatin-like phospholipase family protein [Terrimicrobiaceae bacterium]|nr:patatin-like phospholipase family protein [Terrimicrobiaceae bacterium]
MKWEGITGALLAVIVAAAAGVWVYGRYQQKPVVAEERTPGETPGLRPRDPGQYVKVLAIDGDGLRVIPALHCLAYLEKRSGRPIWELFDVIVGSSAGGLVAAALTLPAGPDKARFTAQEVLDNFPAWWTRISRAPRHHPILSAGGRTAPRLLTRERRTVISEIFGNTQTGEALTTIILPAFALEDRAPFLFASDMGKSTTPSTAAGRAATEAGDFFLADAVMAATADPAVFAPSQIRSIDREQTLTVTGPQLYAANPVLLAAAESLLRHPGRACVVISFGAGVVEAPPASELRELGWDRTADPAALVRMAGEASDVIENQIASTFHRFGSGPLAGYVRLEAILPAGAADPYDTSAANLERLQAASRKLILEKYNALDRTADFLAEP